ncbi:MAG: family finger-like protein [Variovorax sp.]|nr:family finger-like protein [Variovorax sp.]
MPAVAPRPPPDEALARTASEVTAALAGFMGGAGGLAGPAGAAHGVAAVSAVSEAEATEAPSAALHPAMDARWWADQPTLDMPAAADPPDEALRSAPGPLRDPLGVASLVQRAAPEEAAVGEKRAAAVGGLRGRHLWRSGRAGRTPLVLAAVLATALLVVQVLRHERDLLVARQPSLRPVLASLCRITGCELSALRQIDSITIDGAALSREPGGDGWRLSFTLRNAEAMALAMPAVELTLLDTQERPVVRRVLAPADFGAPPVLGARAEQGASLSLALEGAESASLPPVVGYRVVAFYP